MASARPTKATTAFMVTHYDKEMVNERYRLFFCGSCWCCSGLGGQLGRFGWLRYGSRYHHDGFDRHFEGFWAIHDGIRPFFGSLRAHFYGFGLIFSG